MEHAGTGAAVDGALVGGDVVGAVGADVGVRVGTSVGAWLGLDEVGTPVGTCCVKFASNILRLSIIVITGHINL